MPDGDLYKTDFHAWALDQAEKLHFAANIQAPGYDGIDFEQLSREVEDLGHSDRRKVESNLELALRHLIKIGISPQSDTINHWQIEINAFLDSAVDGYSPSMRQYIDLDKLWEKAKKRATRDVALYGETVPDLPEQNPFELEALLVEDFDLDELINTLKSSMPSSQISVQR